jgi:cytochrome P450
MSARPEALTCPVELDMMRPELLADPFGGYGEVREHAPVIRGRFMDGTPAWFVTRFDDVRAILRDPRFVNMPLAAHDGPETDPRVKQLDLLSIPEHLQKYLLGSILDRDQPDHTRLRRLVLGAFTARRVLDLRPSIQRTADQLLDRLPEYEVDGAVDLIDHFTYPLSIAVVCDLVGIPGSDHGRWREWGSNLVSMRSDLLSVSFPVMIDYIHELIYQRRSALGDDLLSALIRTHHDDGNRLSDVELVSMVLTLVIAGHETTAHLIGNSTVALLTHPEQLERLRSNPALLPNAVQELVRWCGSVHVTRLRYATEDLEVADTSIRKGEAVLMFLVAANFDPRHYVEPEKLDVTRQPVGLGEDHVGFGHGIHYCLGATLARQECEIALDRLLQRYPALSLAVEPEQLERMQLPGSWRLHRLPVRL